MHDAAGKAHKLRGEKSDAHNRALSFKLNIKFNEANN